MKSFFSLLALLFYININAQTVVTTQPQYPTETDQITITFDVSNSITPSGKGSLKNYTGTVYAYTCIGINNGTTWLHEKWKWENANNAQSQVTLLSEANHYQFVVNNPRTFYGVTSSSEKITSLFFVLKNSDGTRQTEDIHISLYSSGITVVVKSPTVTSGFGDPARSPVFTSSGSTIPISASTAQIGTVTQSIKLLINGTQITQSATDSLKYSFVADNHPACRNDIMIIAEDNASHKDTARFVIMRNPAVKNLPLPEGNRIGINYESDPAKVTLAFYAPKKSYVYVVGDFGTSDWKVDTSYFMNRWEVKTDSVIWWATIPNLESGKEYSYQFLVDGNLRVYDPYTEKVLDGNNDQYIPASVYPGLKAYPTGKTTGLVSVLQTGQPAYPWVVPQFVRPAKEKLVIYELLIRDFVSTHWYKTITDTISYFKKLGVTAIELMPVIEFEGNDSWGYNPSTYFAPDKYYGTKNDLKAFIDVCHQNGIAVIMDIVLNHAYGSSSMVQLYWDSVYNRPAADNPWFNAINPNTSYTYGNDFNHESKDTKYFVDRVTNYWLTEYKFDGFRFDFTKGFTNKSGEGTAYDASRIAILKRIADKIWSVSPSAYVILEHFCAADEEMELANYGMMLWGNLNYNYNEASMGWISTSNFSNISYKQRGWTVPNLVGYMESHDEERLMYKNLTYGNYVGYSSGTYTPSKDSNGKIIYSIRELPTALNRIELAANLFLLVPGPKMIWQFGELGYDYSINYPSLTSSDRLTAKPVKWDYYLYSGNRRKVYNTFASLSKLKSDYPAFSSADYTLNASGSVKSLYITHSSMNAAVMGNFDITQQDYQAAFQSAGRWYEFYSGDTLDVTDVHMKISLQPGEYRLYTTEKIAKADILTGIKTEDALPNNFILNQNYPNPFNPSTIISYQLPAAGHVTLKVFDLLGREVVTLVDKYENAGTHNARFSASSSQLASGIYFYRLQAGTFVSTKKMVFIK